MSRNSYRKISNFGNNYIMSAASNPLTYCAVDRLTNHMINGFNPDTNGQESKNCQLFLADYCATMWDNNPKNLNNGLCEELCSNRSTTYPAPDRTNPNPSSSVIPILETLSIGEITLVNIARKKYMTKMNNCVESYSQFDPNVPTSPMLLTWKKKGIIDCVPEYDVKSKEIDSDPVMNKVLDKPSIAYDILLGIYKTRVNTGKLEELKGTRLYNFFKESDKFKTSIKTNNLYISQDIQSKYPGMIM